MIPIKYKNIIYAEEKYIMQQCNCLTITSHGLSKTLADYFPHGDAYKGRRPMGRRNCAIKEDRQEPGSVGIIEGDDNLPQIICLYTQFRPGKTTSKYSYPTDYPDQDNDRLRYFVEGLDCLLDYFEDECVKIAVPYKIGCGLAGGNWEIYLKLLTDFHLKLGENEGGLIFYKI
jgi:hypothetical protein